MYKKMWKMRKDKSAVSPVIATILMVAITVVLAAVLYVMVMGFGGGNTSTPTASLGVTKGATVNATGPNQETTYTISVLSISSNNVLPTDVNVICVTTAATSGQLVSAAGASHVNAGDYVSLGLKPGTYTVSLIYKPTGNAIASTQIVVS
jgi:archaeal type IV pilus assembly protein PilA